MKSRMQRLHLLPLALAAIVFGTAVPVEWRAPVLGPLNLSVPDVLINLLLYAPLGLALWRRPLGATLAIAAVLSGSIEVLQMWAFERDSSPIDVLANLLGAAAGHALARHLAAARGLRCESLPLDRRALLLAALAAGVLITAWAWPARPSSLANWDAGFELLLGNERTADRPWRGELATLALVPAALSPHEIRALADLSALGDRAVLARIAGPGAYLLPAPLSLQGGSAAARIAPEAARRFLELAVERNAFTLVASLSTADITQTGPARVVSFSADPFNRNFDLGQKGDRLIFRVRTPVTGPNGMNPRTETPSVLEEGRATAVAASFDGSVARIYVDGQTRGRANLAAAGCLLRNLCDSDLPIATALFGGLLAAIALGLLVPRSRPRAVALSLAAGASGALLLRALQAVQEVPLFEGWTPLLALAGAGCAGIAAVADEPTAVVEPAPVR